jgi:hypothetical protein
LGDAAQERVATRLAEAAVTVDVLLRAERDESE